jgi:hypothetical protein
MDVYISFEIPRFQRARQKWAIRCHLTVPPTSFDDDGGGGGGGGGGYLTWSILRAILYG